MKKISKNNLINFVIIILYAVITFIIMLHHEPWRDEAQAWLLAENLSFTNILEFSKHEGHPMLWHLILMPFAKLSFPYLTLNVISWIFMLLSAILIIYKSPFDRFLKISILISSPFLYFYVSIARVYSLIAFLIILIATIYNKKEEMPCVYGLLILLLANTHITMLGMVGILILEFYGKDIFLAIKNKKLKDNKKLFLGFSISVIGVLLVFIQLIGCISTNEEVGLIQPKNYFTMFSTYIVALVSSYISECNEILLVLFMIVFSLVAFWQFSTFKKHKNSILIFYASITFQILIYVLVYQYLTQNILTTYFIMLFCIWITHYEKDNLKEKLILDIILIAISLATILYTCKMINLDLKYNYSSAKETAEFINSNIEKGAIIISTEDITASSVVPYCKDYLFYSPQRNELFTYVKWDKKRKVNIDSNNFKEIIKQLQINNNVYILSSKLYLPDVINYLEENNEILEIFKADVSLRGDEIYYLYEINDI